MVLVGGEVLRTRETVASLAPRLEASMVCADPRPPDVAALWSCAEFSGHVRLGVRKSRIN